MTTICDQLESLRTSNEASKPKNIPPKPPETDKVMTEIWNDFYGEKEYFTPAIMLGDDIKDDTQKSVTIFFRDVQTREKYKAAKPRHFTIKDTEVYGIPATIVTYDHPRPPIPQVILDSCYDLFSKKGQTLEMYKSNYK